jgi:DNA repair protein RecO (recombination protein O)
MEIQTTGYVLRRYRFSESSLVVVWLTLGHGKIKTSVRGALGPKSKVRAAVDLFQHSELTAKKGGASELWSLREARMIECLYPAGASLPVLESASYFASLLDRVTQTGEAVDSLYELFGRAMRYLAENQPARKAVFHFEKELCRCLGVGGGSDPASTLAGYSGGLPEARERLLLQLEP